MQRSDTRCAEIMNIVERQPVRSPATSAASAISIWPAPARSRSRAPTPMSGTFRTRTISAPRSSTFPIRASRAWSPPSRSTITTSHSHKVRVVGDIMIVNHERNMTTIGRRAEQLPAARRELAEALGREPTHGGDRREAARDRTDDLPRSRNSSKRGYHNGGFKIYDVSKPSQPKLDLLPEDRRHRRAPLRHGRALRLHLDRDAGLCRQHPRHLRLCAIRAAAGSLAAGGCRAAYRGRRDADLVRAGGTGCTMRCASATRCGRAAGMAASGSSTSPTCPGPRVPAATTIIRCFRSRRTP